jgi:Protein of unknown function (DUF2569)
MPNIFDPDSRSKGLKIAFILISLHASLFIATPVLAVDELDSAVKSVRSLWSLWNIIVIILCVARRKKEIGGWLLYYYVQLYSGAIFSIILLMFSSQNYLPATWGGATGLYLLFLLSTIPNIMILFIELIYAERLRKSRNFTRIRPVRIVLWFHLGFAVLGLLIDLMAFRDNIPLAVIGLIFPTIWLPYFYYSKRVKKVFRTHDWIAKQSPAAKA